MRNLIDERPTATLYGGNAYTLDFVQVGDLADKDVLDIGCGFGWFELAARKRGARAVVGVEPEEEALSTARRWVDSPGVSFRTASAVELPFADASFDTVVMWEVLEHLPKHTEQRAFAEIARVLRPGGAFYLSTPHGSLRARVTDPAWWLIGHRHYAPQRVAGLARAAGLTVQTIESKAGWWQIVHVNDLYVSKWVLRRPPVLARVVEPRLAREWERPGGFAHVYLAARKLPA